MPRGSGHVLWVSTALDTRGGVASCVRTLGTTRLARDWSVRHIATHREGSALTRLMAFVRGGTAFLAALARRRPALVHIHTASRGSFARKSVLALAARAAGVPVILHVHGGEFHLFHDGSPAPVRWAIRSTLARSAAVVALGETWAARLRRISPDAEIIVVPNPVASPAVAPAPFDHAGTPDDPDRVHVVFLGRIGDAKGAFTLLEAWAKAVTGSARLTLAGDGEVARARRQVSELGVESSVTVSSWLTPDEASSLLDSAHVLVLPSRAEGQPMAVLEAMARGLCVIGSDVGGLPELLGDGRGFIIQPDDPAGLADVLARVLDEPATRARVGARAREHVQRTYDAAVVADRLDALYRTVAAR